MNFDFHASMEAAHDQDSTGVRETFRWHGWEVPDLSASIHVGPYFDRKQLALYVDVRHEGHNYVDVLAYFRNDHYARAGLAFLDALARNRLAENPPRFHV